MSHILSAHSPKTVQSLRSEIFLRSHLVQALSPPFRISTSPIRRLHYRKNKITLLMCSVSQFLSEGAVRRRYRTDSPSIISFLPLSRTRTLFPFFLLSLSPFCQFSSYTYTYMYVPHENRRNACTPLSNLRENFQNASLQQYFEVTNFVFLVYQKEEKN